MTIEETYPFRPADFNNGVHKSKDKYLFLDLIRECEKDFQQKHKPLSANTFCANSKTLYLLGSCLDDRGKHIYGMESRDGEIDLDMNLEMEEYSDNDTVYAIERFDDEEEPLILVVDNNCSDREFILKYSPDNGEEDITEDMPEQPSKVKKPDPVRS